MSGNVEEEYLWSVTLNGTNPEYTWDPKEPGSKDEVDDEDLDPSVQPNHRLLVKSAILHPSAKKDEVTMLEVTTQGYQGDKVVAPFLAMRGGKDLQQYVDLLLPDAFKIKIISGEGPVTLVGSHCVDFYNYNFGDDEDEEEDAESSEDEAADMEEQETTEPVTKELKTKKGKEEEKEEPKKEEPKKEEPKKEEPKKEEPKKEEPKKEEPKKEEPKKEEKKTQNKEGKKRKVSEEVEEAKEEGGKKKKKSGDVEGKKKRKSTGEKKQI